MNDSLFNIIVACDSIKATILENVRLKAENVELRERIAEADAARDEGFRSAERYHEEMVKSLLSGELVINKGGN
jgi:regulator of replication initiation timing